MLVLGQFVLGIVGYGIIADFKTFRRLLTELRLVHAVNALSVATDVAIALALVFLLRKTRSGIRQSDTLINKLIAYSINTSLVTSICSVGVLITTIVWPQTFIFLFFIFTFPRGKLY